MLNIKLAKNKMENEEGMNHLLIEVEPEETNEKITKPVAFVLALDVSGSMNDWIGSGNWDSLKDKHFYLAGMRKPFGQKDDFWNFNFGKDNFAQNELPKVEVNTKLDYVKQASEKLVDMMKDGDMLGIVSFSDSAFVEYPLTELNQDVRFKMKDRIRALSTRGMTNVSGGLELAYEQIPDNLKETHHIKMILLSDGHANSGITDSDSMASKVQEYRGKDLSVATIGVGNDYNSYFMEIIASVSGGMFYHLKNMEELDSILTKELETLMQLTTKQATLKIKLDKGLYIEENLNGFKEESGKIYIGNVFSKQNILSEVYTKDEVKCGIKNIEITLEYIDSEGKNKVLTKSIELSVVEEEEMGNVEVHQGVVDLVKQMLEAKAKKDALRSYEDGKFEDAQGFVKSTQLKMKTMGSSYDMDFNDKISELDGLSNSFAERKIQKDEVKEMYSMSYRAMRSIDEE